jgi:hypothetical protein
LDNNHKWRFWEWPVVRFVLVGVAEIAAGILCIYIPISMGFQESSISRSILHDLAVAFLAAGALTISIELMHHANFEKELHRLHNQTLEDIKDIKTEIMGNIATLQNNVDTSISSLQTTTNSTINSLTETNKQLIGELKDAATANVVASIDRLSTTNTKLIDELKEAATANVAALAKAAGDKLMREAINGDSIYNSIDQFVIRQPFRRSNFKATIALDWDKSHEHITKQQTVEYTIENAFPTVQRSEIVAFDERKYEGYETYDTSIHYVRVEVFGEAPVTYSRARLKEMAKQAGEVGQEEKQEEKTGMVMARVPLELKSKGTARVVSYSESVLPTRDVVVMTLVQPTSGVELTIIHPDDLCVSANPLFPDRDALQSIHDSARRKMWRIDTGLLPYQGIELIYYPKPAEAQK